MAAAMVAYQKNYVTVCTKNADGVLVQPVVPPPDKHGRDTNQLRYIRYTIMNALSKHKDAKFFREPVNPGKLKIPTYYNFIYYPMDLKTIRQRLVNKYYWGSAECIRDFQFMFANTYVYNDPESAIVKSAQNLEKAFLAKLMDLPENEIEGPSADGDTDASATLQDSEHTESEASRSLRDRSTRRQPDFFINTPYYGGRSNPKVQVSEVSRSRSSSDSESEECDSANEDYPSNLGRRNATSRQILIALLQEQMVTIQKQLDVLKEDEKNEMKEKERIKLLTAKKSVKRSSETNHTSKKAKIANGELSD